jgi:hypothetical protein
LWHCVRDFWVLYSSILIAMWQRLGRWNISWDFAVLGKVTRKSGREMTLDSSEGDRRMVVICLTLTTSKPRLTNLSEMSSAGVSFGKFMGFYDFG